MVRMGNNLGGMLMWLQGQPLTFHSCCFQQQQQQQQQQQ